jgi:hypothetical protein
MGFLFGWNVSISDGLYPKLEVHLSGVAAKIMLLLVNGIGFVMVTFQSLKIDVLMLLNPKIE